TYGGMSLAPGIATRGKECDCTLANRVASTECCPLGAKKPGQKFAPRGQDISLRDARTPGAATSGASRWNGGGIPAPISTAPRASISARRTGRERNQKR